MELRIEKIESVLQDLKLTEMIDTVLLDKLIQSDLLQTDAWINNDGEKICYNNEKEHLLALRKKVKNGTLDVTYKTSKLGVGRVYPQKSLSLCSIRREIRHTLANGKYIDIDIDNCHPVLLLQLCEKNDIDCECLTKYVKNRDKHLNQVMTKYNVSRDCAKQLFIRLLYFGSFNRWKDDNDIDEDEDELPFIKAFAKELKYIVKDIVDANPKL